MNCRLRRTPLACEMAPLKNVIGIKPTKLRHKLLSLQFLRLLAGNVSIRLVRNEKVRDVFRERRRSSLSSSTQGERICSCVSNVLCEWGDIGIALLIKATFFGGVRSLKRHPFIFVAYTYLCTTKETNQVVYG